MNDRLREALYEYAKLLKEDARVLRMRDLEKRLTEDEEVVALSRAMDEAERLYSEALATNDQELIEKRKKELYEAKLALDTNPLAKEYTESYIAVRDLYAEIDDILFSPYRRKVISKEIL